MIIPRIARNSHSSMNTMRKKTYRILLLTYWAEISEIDFPWFLKDMTKAEKSCTAPMTIDPTKTQIIAGTQPQMTAIAGPTIGPVPAIEVKWWPKMIPFFVGT
jgi:hypothetical protein